MKTLSLITSLFTLIALNAPLKSEIRQFEQITPQNIASKKIINDEEKEDLIDNPFGMKLYKKINPKNLSQKKHCDVLRHLKVPATSRRLDTYMRPEFILPRRKNDQLLSTVSNDSRQKIYESGIDLYLSLIHI